MQIVLGRFIKKKEDFDSENIICPIKDYDRDKYLNRRIIIRTLFVILYGYGLGYTIGLNFNTINDIKITLINFTLFYVLNFYLIQIPHEFIHVLFYSKGFTSKKNKIVFFNKKRIVTTELKEDTNNWIMILSLITPFLVFSILPILLINNIGFDIYLYTLSFANAILSSEDLLNIILLLFSKKNDKGKKALYVIPNNYNYLLNNNTPSVNDNNTSSVENNEISNVEIDKEVMTLEDTSLLSTYIESETDESDIIDNDFNLENVEENKVNDAIIENEKNPKVYEDSINEIGVSQDIQTIIEDTDILNDEDKCNVCVDANSLIQDNAINDVKNNFNSILVNKLLSEIDELSFQEKSEEDENNETKNEISVTDDSFISNKTNELISVIEECIIKDK